jgi:hypothetical protein
MSTPVTETVPTNICANCPAAFALGAYAADLESAPPEDMSASRLAMSRNESVVAQKALNQAAGTIACHKFQTSSIELPEEVPPVGSPELIGLVSQCPSFPEYLKVRTGQPVLATKIGLAIAKILPRKR